MTEHGDGGGVAQAPTKHFEGHGLANTIRHQLMEMNVIAMEEFSQEVGSGQTIASIKMKNVNADLPLRGEEKSASGPARRTPSST